MRSGFGFFLGALIVIFGTLIFSNSIWWILIFLPLLLVFGVFVHDVTQKKRSILRNFPVFGHGRYLADWLRPKLYQYFVEPDYDGRPFSRLERSVIYQRAKKETDTTPFGTQYNVYQEGYEWIGHSILAKDGHKLNFKPRTKIGGSSCLQPYDASILNISAMSYGSLSSAAVEALNGGALLGSFAHNTGEGGIAPYHIKHGGDLIYQIGTGYFGCRDEVGNFNDDLFREKAALPNVKMIEIKLSQGAKPGHGGILPAKKASPEIAAIRNIKPYTDVISPPYHKAFSTPIELLQFIKKCRDLSSGKPIGFKICIGQKHEFLGICKAMIETGILPDFITIDGGEGGTGAAPLEFSNHVGMPLEEGLTFAYNCLVGFNLKKQIQLIAAGKVVTGFQIFKCLALGADLCYSARGMMMALGCIQALECNKNTCPTGVATQDPSLIKGLDIADKRVRVFNFHQNTVKSFVELMGASGLDTPDQINRLHVTRRIDKYHTKSYLELFPYVTEGALLDGATVPSHLKTDWSLASPISFKPKFDMVFVQED